MINSERSYLMPHLGLIWSSERSQYCC